MSDILQLAFWVATALIAYVYLLYPLYLWFFPIARPWKRGPHHGLSVSIVIAARNEEQRIVECVRNSLKVLDDSGVAGEVIVVSDGSTDHTAELVRNMNEPQARLLELQVHRGKAVALNRGCALAVHDIIVFADTRQTWKPSALGHMLSNFADPKVGGVSGELVLKEADGTLAGIGLYWRFEKWMRRRESARHSCVGVTGAVAAVRRELFRPIPPGTILDDVYWPMRVVLDGYRVVHDDQAIVYDRLPSRRRDELRRKIRTLSGNFQIGCRLPSILNPFRNPIFVALVSHKLARLVVPWAMLAAFISSAFLVGPIYRLAFIAQIALYAIGLAGMYRRVAERWRPAGTLSAFLFLNGACLLAFFVWLGGGARSSWHCVNYETENSEVGRTEV